MCKENGEGEEGNGERKKLRKKNRKGEWVNDRKGEREKGRKGERESG